MPLTREERHEKRKQKIAESHKEAKAGLKANEKRLSQALSELETVHLLHKLLGHFQARLVKLPNDTPLVFGREIPLTGGVLKQLFPKGATKSMALARLDPYLCQLAGKKAALCSEISQLEEIAGLHSERLSVTVQLKDLHQEKIKAERLKQKTDERKRAAAGKKREQKAKKRARAGKKNHARNS
jgi:hypothetical protein